ncbi:FAD:protein FMN transferase [Pseudonocardia eucalypti]|uniref:FAD:protein FMN transferase n=1 Tax=Pseudonocardia eucalypti TaxID=648755 RepID=A0ABP9RDW9_9PSEU|nr:thiamine biosynthesis lipoprotein [Pseudonocardia eucalypti]
MSTLTDRPAAPGRVGFPALGTTVLLLVSDPALAETAEAVLRAQLAELDRACSRFRADSEITDLHRRAGRVTHVGPLLGEALDVALRAAELTDGLVDPTVGAAMHTLGYDRDFAEVAATDPGPAAPATHRIRPAPGWWRLHWEPATREVLLPRGVHLDLGATAKALAADRAAASAARATGCGVLVSIGGDVSVAGPAPDGGWRIAVADDHRDALDAPDQAVAISGGGLATSSTAVRAWHRGGRRHHHIVDPRTGNNPDPVWRTVTVAARNCVDANIASTASVVLGTEAPTWLAEHHLPARLVAEDGRIERTPGWPAEDEGV